MREGCPPSPPAAADVADYFVPPVTFRNGRRTFYGSIPHAAFADAVPPPPPDATPAPPAPPAPLSEPTVPATTALVPTPTPVTIAVHPLRPAAAVPAASGRAYSVPHGPAMDAAAEADGFERVVRWNFQDLSMLIGSDMPIFGDPHHPAVSLKLRDMSKPINVLTGLDDWYAR